MTVTYKGMTQDFEYRVAEVNYDDENKKEVELVERTIFLMEKVKGYKIDTVTPGYVQCEVEDKAEYMEFAKEWREIVKMFKLCKKFGF